MALQVWLPLNGDLTNNGLENVTISGSGTFTADGKIGKCLSGGSNIGITSQTLANSKTWSVCFWGYVVSANVTANWTKIIQMSDNGSNLRVEVSPKSYGSGTFCYSAANNASYKITNDSSSAPSGGFYDQWHHFCMTSDGTTICVYDNGTLRSTMSYNGSGAITGTFTLNNNSIIKKNDFRIYDNALSPKEIEVLSRGLVCHYPLSLSGENLLANSIPTITSGWNVPNNTDWSRTLVDAEGSYNGKAMRGTYSGTAGGQRGGIYKTFSPGEGYFSEGDTYTITARLRASINCTIRFYNTYSAVATQDITTEWATYTYTATVATPTANGRTIMYIEPSYVTTGVWIECCMIKLEKGGKSTPWIPYASDDAYTAMGYNSTTEYDVSGYGYNGVKHGSLSYNTDTPRYFVSTLTPNGISDYISASVWIGDNKNITMSLWMKSTDGSIGTGNYHILLSIDNDDYEFSMGTGGLFRHGFRINSTRYVGDYGTTNCLDKKWHMLTATYDGSNIKRYVDGELVNTTAVSGTLQYTGGRTLAIGKFISGNTYGNKNILTSDVRIYATALSDTQVAELYNTAISVSNNGALLGYELVEV